MSRIAELCEELADAYEQKGQRVRGNLRPGLSRDEVESKLAESGIAPPRELVDLYEWANGHKEPDYERSVLFRDNALLSLDEGIESRQYMLPSSLEEDLVDLTKAFPIAGFEGAFYAVSCGQQLHSPQLMNPVISVFEGVDLFYHSIETMLRTCVAWVSHPDWSLYMPQFDERQAWKQFNPNVKLAPDAI